MNVHAARPSGRAYIIHTDGACLGNPGPGGWAATIKLVEDGTEISRAAISGGEPSTTTNIRMEMRAPIEALKTLPEDRSLPVAVFCDNQMVVRGMTEWMPGWLRRNWRGSGGKPVANKELWQELLALTDGRNITWHWIRGHNGDPDNEEVDGLASAAALGASTQLSKRAAPQAPL